MKRLFLLVFLFIFLYPAAALAEPVEVYDASSTVSSSGDIVPVASPSQGGGEALIAKTNQMAGKLHSAASRIIIPLAIIILILGAVFGIFFKAARSIAVFAIIGAVLVYWAPMLVTALINWIK